MKSEKPSRAVPVQQVLEDRVQNRLTSADCDDELEVGDTLESPAPAEIERRVYAFSGRKQRRRNAKPRCRRCGKHWNTDEWNFHRREPTESEIESYENRPQNRYLRHGPGNQVWDWCRVNERDYEPGFLCFGKPMPRAR